MDDDRLDSHPCDACLDSTGVKFSPHDSFQSEHAGKVWIVLAGCGCRHGPGTALALSSPQAGVVLRIRRKHMAEHTKVQVIHRAYEPWEQAGKPEGRDDEFYHQAERELQSADSPKETPDDVRL